MTDRLIKDKIASLDHVKPPTNWNPNSTWRQINKTTYFSRRILSMAALILLLFSVGISWLLIGNGEAQPTPMAETNGTEEMQMANEPSSGNNQPTELEMVVEEITESIKIDEPSLVKESLNISFPPVQDDTINPKIQMKPSSTIQIAENLVDSVTLDPDSILSKMTLANQIIDSVDLKSDTSNSIEKPQLKISIVLNGDQNPAQSSEKSKSRIIKLKSDYNFSNDKKFYTLQIK